jgi:hypothetical protein
MVDVSYPHSKNLGEQMCVRGYAGLGAGRWIARREAGTIDLVGCSVGGAGDMNLTIYQHIYISPVPKYLLFFIKHN